jgi:hypothetical protein
VKPSQYRLPQAGGQCKAKGKSKKAKGEKAQHGPCFTFTFYLFTFAFSPARLRQAVLTFSTARRLAYIRGA